MKLQRIFAYTFFAVALLFAQQGALAHGISHYLSNEAPLQQDQQLPHSKVCDKCIAYAGINGALHSDSPIILLHDADTGLFTSVAHPFISLSFLAFCPRAPPVFL
ncbi:MAG TPA: hypothetical protein VNN78_02085 [Burkholderiales bacterium]|nr:hypothetical protein [Burkholderiales bacterium]